MSPEPMPDEMSRADTRLTSLAHGGGCGCKLSPAVLRDLLSGVPAMSAFPNLLVGTETGDDAAVYRINERQAVVATWCAGRFRWR